MRALLRTFIVVVLCLLLASPAGAARRGDPPSRRDLQRKADVAAVRYDRAEAALERLADDISGLERRISDSEAAMAPLRAGVTRRAVALYTGDRAAAPPARLADDISGLERRITASAAAMAPLRAGVTRRAAALYTSDRALDASSGLSTGDDLVESARGATLASGASARDYTTIRR